VISDLPTTFVWMGLYMQDCALGGRMGPRPSVDDRNTFILSLPLPPSATLPLVDVDKDLGAVVEAIFSRDPSTTAGKIYSLGTPTTLQDMTSSYDRVLARQGKKLVYHQIEDDNFLAFMGHTIGEVLARALFEMFKTLEDVGGQVAPAGRDVAVKTELGIDLTSWEDFLEGSI
jgi:hypothetical protein